MTRSCKYVLHLRNAASKVLILSQASQSSASVTVSRINGGRGSPVEEQLIMRLVEEKRTQAAEQIIKFFMRCLR
jgi:hypothetical protein